MNDILSEMRKLPHISVSQLKTYISCPRRFRLHYIDNVEPAFRPVALALGTAWHTTIGHLLKTHSEGKADSNGALHERLHVELAAELHADELPVLFEDDEPEQLFVDRAMRMLDAFLEKYELPHRVLGIEIPFSLELVDHEIGEALAVPMIGGIDAVVVSNGTPTVLELKTGKRRWGEDQLAFDLQPTAYQMAARHLGFGEPELELVLTTKGKEPTVQVEQFVRGEADERDLVTTAFSVLRAVDAGVDHPVRGWQCRGCQYQGACR
jgi:putative RecB family exonuclease